MKLKPANSVANVNGKERWSYSRGVMHPRARTLRKSRLALAGWIVVGLVLIGAMGRYAIFKLVERDAFITPPAGSLTPDALGTPSIQLSFQRGAHVLRASHVAARDDDAPALLIFHGDEEELSRWAAVQGYLHPFGVASFVFDYSGYGASTGRPTIDGLKRDGEAAYARFVASTPGARRRYVLGYSLGSAVLLDVVASLRPAPDGVILAAGFASAREMAVVTGLVPGWAAWILPDVWNNEAQVADLRQPLLIVHSTDDELIPFAHAQRVCAAAKASGRLVAIESLSHDAPLGPLAAEAFWRPVIDLLRSGELPCRDAKRTGCSSCSPNVTQ